VRELGSAQVRMGHHAGATAQELERVLVEHCVCDAWLSIEVDEVVVATESMSSVISSQGCSPRA
jgi:hypothetical protein